MTERVRLVRMEYLMHRRDDPPLKVTGYAFETPGWPEWHACVRWGNRWGDDVAPAWIIDHYDTGFSISECGMLERKEDAPEAMLRLLESKGREFIAKKLASVGLADLLE